MTERFTLLTELGRGGMGVVWKARDEDTGQIVALKVMREMYAEDADYVARFERELELAKRINSVHVVKVLGFGVRQKVPYLALEYVDGPSLHDALAQHGPYTWPEARGLLLQIAQGLADAHSAGIIHRDVKPSNVLIGPDGIAKLTDFGIARGLDATRMTATSTMLGTPAYLAPEGPKDARSDLYSLGIIGYQLLTGAVPFNGQSYQEILLAHLRDAPDLARLPAETRPIIGWLLAKDPAARPHNAWEVMPVVEGRLFLAPPTHGRSPQDAPAPVASGPRGAFGAAAPVQAPRPVRAAAPIRSTPPRSEDRVDDGIWLLASTELKGARSIYARQGHTATALAYGHVLLAGGTDLVKTLGSADVYESRGGTVFRYRMAAPRVDHTAALLGDGSVLISGGNDGEVVASAEVYDPTTGSFLKIGSMITRRELHTATLLSNGAVLVAGGRDGERSLQSAELYEPSTRHFVRAGQMSCPRAGHTATPLLDGRVLVLGGDVDGEPIDTADIYEANSAWSQPVGSMATARVGHTATLLPTGAVLITGGAESRNWSVRSAEVFDPRSGVFRTVSSMRLVRDGHTATLTPLGLVLIVGGANDTGALAAVEAYDPVEGEFFDVGHLKRARVDHTATLLPDGRVFIAGGLDKDGRPLDSVELLTLEHPR
jgi:hypothetical protein